MGRSRFVIGLVVATFVAFAVAGAAHAVVPPRDCGRMTLKGKPYQVKVDQITCAEGKRFTRDYIEHKVTPGGYRCRNYPTKKGRVKFYCANGRRVFFGIRR